MARRKGSSKIVTTNNLMKVVLILGILILAPFVYSMYTGGGVDGILEKLGGGTGNGGGEQIVQPFASNLWDARGSIDIQAPDLNLTVEDARYSLTETVAYPTSDGIYAYMFTENPFTLAPNNTFYSDYDRIEYLVSEGKYIAGTTYKAITSSNAEILDGSILTGIVKTPAVYGETDGKIYCLLLDNDYVEGTPTTLIDGWPVVLEIDLRTVPAYRADATPDDHHITFGMRMAGISQVWPADAGGASNAWTTATAGWPELGSATVTLPTANVPADLNSTADNYQGARITLGNGGVYFWQDTDLCVRIDANSTTQSFTKFKLGGTTELKDVKTAQIGGITYYFVKIPRDKAKAGATLDITAYYDATETTTTVDYMPCIVEWNSLGTQLATSANARIADLDTTNITSSVHCP